MKGKDTSITVHNLSVNDRDVTSHRGIANALADNFSYNSHSVFSKDAFASVHMKAKKQTIKFSSDMLRYTTGSSLWKRCMMLCLELMILQQDQMKYTITY